MNVYRDEIRKFWAAEVELRMRNSVKTKIEQERICFP